MKTYKLDVTGLPCPMPLIKLKQAMATQEVDVIELHASDPGALRDIPAFGTQQGVRVEVASSEEAPYIFNIYVNKVKDHDV